MGISLCAIGQKRNAWVDTISQRLGDGRKNAVSTCLFVHFDKTIYGTNETVYFTGYLLKTDLDISAYNTLFVALVNEANNEIFVQEKYAIQKGISTGAFTVPDTLPSGNYSIIAFTNRLAGRLPEDVFVQHIKIKNTDNRANAVLTLLDTPIENKDSLDVLLTASDEYNKPLVNIRAKFNIDKKSGTADSVFLFTNKKGEALLRLNRNDLPNRYNPISAGFQFNGIRKEVSILIPPYQKYPRVGFFPEGGNLVTNLQSTIGWEVRLPDGAPLMTSALLYENNKLIDTIQTNGYGMGRFTLATKQNCEYTVRLAGQEYSDSLFHLPTSLPLGSVMHVENPLANDTLKVRIDTDNSIANSLLIVHDYTDIYYAFELNSKKGSNNYAIPLTKLPRGLFEVALLAGSEKPLAQCLFYANYDKRKFISIHQPTDSLNLNQQISIGVRLNPGKEATGKAVVSIACVQNERIDLSKTKNIEDYLYLERPLGSLPLQHTILSDSGMSSDFLRNLLLVKGWRKYNWKDITDPPTADTSAGRSSLHISGQIIKNGRPADKIIEFNSIIDSTIGLLKTDSHGKFTLSYEDLVVSSKKGVSFFMNEGERSNYEFRFQDEYSATLSDLLTRMSIVDSNVVVNRSDSKALLLRKAEGIHVLNEVTVTSKKGEAGFHPFKGTGSMNENECGDYVCYNQILNCPNHKKDVLNKAPVVGEKYYTRFWPSKTTYFGCKEIKQKSIPSSVTLKGIYDNTEFYSEDNSHSKITDTDNPTTLYWNPGLIIDDEKEVKILINTGKQPGKFRLIIQGRTNDDVIYSESILLISDEKPGIGN